MRCARPVSGGSVVAGPARGRAAGGRWIAACAGRGPRTGRRAGGFTLVEVLMVVVIIALLIGLLLPAINSVMSTARERRVSAEIQSLASAIADFKAQFGFEPPSAMVLYEDGSAWDANDAITRESRSVLRRMFPQIEFNVNRDFDGDGNPSGPNPNPIRLNGAQCLVFFLGGMLERQDPSDPNSPVSMIGFAKNPRDPFSRTDQNRVGPFFSEFNTGRLIAGQNGMVSFRDPLPAQTNAYWYVSSNEGRGYRTPATQNDPQNLDLLGSGMWDVYRASPPDTTSNPPKPGTAHNAKSYQIISPGYDGQYGTGGYYDPDQPDSSLSVVPLNFPSGNTRQSERERDNMTNFHLGRLAR